jgi:hypothetical protein
MEYEELEAKVLHLEHENEALKAELAKYEDWSITDKDRESLLLRKEEYYSKALSDSNMRLVKELSKAKAENESLKLYAELGKVIMQSPKLMSVLINNTSEYYRNLLISNFKQIKERESNEKI